MSLRVAIVEDSAQLREDFAQIVNESADIVCVAAYGTAEAALSDLPAQTVDAVLMDINLPGLSGIDCTRALKATLPSVQVVMLTAFDDSNLIFESLKAGATGYVLKRARATEILDALREVCAGGSPMSGAIARKVVQFFSGRSPAADPSSLTEREREVLTGLSEGKQYKGIATDLEVSINTVRKHVKAIYEKLQVGSRAEAVRKLGAP